MGIMIEKAYTKCHGDPTKINPEVMKVIKSSYPEDKAIGFDTGDFRGAMVAEISEQK